MSYLAYLAYNKTIVKFAFERVILLGVRSFLRGIYANHFWNNAKWSIINKLSRLLKLGMVLYQEYTNWILSLYQGVYLFFYSIVWCFLLCIFILSYLFFCILFTFIAIVLGIKVKGTIKQSPELSYCQIKLRQFGSWA